MLTDLTTPVAFIVFNRPNTTRRVFEAIAAARPSRLFLIADGARTDKPGDVDACREVREIVSRVDWPCEVMTNFAETNLGCRDRVVSGLDWVFSLVEEAIILEDDCLPDSSFFPFCAELLDRYRDDMRVAAISGTCLVEEHLSIEASYYFSQLAGIWGWATWRSRWMKYERGIETWPDVKSQNVLIEFFNDRRSAAYWTKVFDAIFGKAATTWDYQWFYTCIRQNSLMANSSTNLIRNIGFGPNATHTGVTNGKLTPPSGSVSFPLQHPASYVPLRSADRKFEEIILGGLGTRMAARVKRLTARLGSRA